MFQGIRTNFIIYSLISLGGVGWKYRNFEKTMCEYFNDFSYESHKSPYGCRSNTFSFTIDNIKYTAKHDGYLEDILIEIEGITLYGTIGNDTAKWRKKIPRKIYKVLRKHRKIINNVINVLEEKPCKNNKKWHEEQNILKKIL